MQRSLFDIPIAHTGDPATSHEAARQHTASGKRSRHAQLVLALVRRHPGQTAIELYDLATLEEQAELKEPQEVRRRLVDLLQTGQVRQTEARPCRMRGTRMMTWIATPKE